MKLWARIAVYLILFTVEAGFFFGMAELAYPQEQRKVYALDVEMSRATAKHIKTMGHLQAVHACMHLHPSLGKYGCELHITSNELSKTIDEFSN